MPTRTQRTSWRRFSYPLTYIILISCMLIPAYGRDPNLSKFIKESTKRYEGCPTLALEAYELVEALDRLLEMTEDNSRLSAKELCPNIGLLISALEHFPYSGARIRHLAFSGPTYFLPDLLEVTFFGDDLYLPLKYICRYVADRNFEAAHENLKDLADQILERIGPIEPEPTSLFVHTADCLY